MYHVLITYHVLNIFVDYWLANLVICDECYSFIDFFFFGFLHDPFASFDDFRHDWVINFDFIVEDESGCLSYLFWVES